MALTPSRWMVVATLACAAIMTALLPVQPPDRGRRFLPGQSTRLQRVTGQLERARETLTVAALADSVLAIARGSPLPSGGKPTVLDLGSASAEEKRAFAQAVNRWWPETGLDTSVAVGLVLGGDSRDMTWQAKHLLPASGDGRTCVTLVPTQTWKLVARLPGPRALELSFASELGPCLFLAMNGRPGPGIEQWLGGRGLDFISYFNPSGRTIGESIEIPEDLPIQFSLFEPDWGLFGTMPLGIKCLVGQIEECTAGIASDPSIAPISSGFQTPVTPWRAPFGSLTGSFITDLQRDMGPTRFREFWRSPGTLEEAIHRVTGRSLGEWTHDWAIGRHNAVRRGPLPEQRSVLRVAGLTLLLLGAAAVYSVRRTVA